MSAVVVASAPWTWTESLVARLRAADLIVAADGGANHLARVGVRPAAVVGDLDSITAPVRAWVGEDRLVHRPDQDFTDLHKTLSYCLDEQGVRALTVMAATGGRLDHTLENLGVVARFAARCDLVLLTGEQRVLVVNGELEVATTPGDMVSLIPLGRCSAVWTRGLVWELDGEMLDIASRTSISNRARGTSVRIRVTGGTAMLFLPDRPTG